MKKKMKLFGKNVSIVVQELNKDQIKLDKNQILIGTYEKSPNILLKEFLADVLYNQLVEIYDKIIKQGQIEIFRDLDFEIVEKIDNKKERVAKFEGKKIKVKLNAISLPKSALKYMIGHEIAHTIAKTHTKQFWKIVKTIDPNYEKGKKLLTKYERFLQEPFNVV